MPGGEEREKREWRELHEGEESREAKRKNTMVLRKVEQLMDLSDEKSLEITGHHHH